jgi:hypothetical protein
MFGHYGALRSALRKLVDELPPGRRASLERYVPPPLPADLVAVAGEALVKVAGARTTMREKTVPFINANKHVILGSAELVFAQCDRLVTKVVSEIDRIRLALAAGEPVEFPVTVSDTYFVVRPDGGGLGTGLQTIFVQIERLSALWEQCAVADLASGVDRDRRHAAANLSAAARERIEPREEGRGPHVDGYRYDASQEEELRVVYVMTLPAVPGGECVEPYWAELFRSRLFDLDRSITPAERSVREALVGRLGAEPANLYVPGLLSFGSKHDRALTRYYRRMVSKDRFPFPAEEFRHALAIGRVVLRPELLRGMRIGESSQATEDAFDVRKVNGRIFYYVKVAAKASGGRRRRMVLDEHTVGAYERVREIAVRRWFRLEGRMPIRTFHDVERRGEVGPARYLMANHERMLTRDEMNLCLRVLTFGVVSSTSHSFKYGFVDMLIEAEAPEHVVNAASNHVVGSVATPTYSQFSIGRQIDELLADAQRDARKGEIAWQLLDGVEYGT